MTSQFLYWSYETQSYHPVPTDASSEPQTAETGSSADETQATSTDNSAITSDKNSSEGSLHSASSQPAADAKYHLALEEKTKKEKAMNAKKIVKVCFC